MTTSVVLLPGLLCDYAVWTPLTVPFSKAQRLIPDYGQASSIEEMAQLVLEQAPDTFILMGHSMGGRVALEVYRQAPHRVSRLILMDTGFKPKAQGEAGLKEQQGRFALLEKANTQGMREMGETWLAGMVHPDRLQDTRLIEAILQMIERKTPEVFAAQINALLNRPDATPVLENIQCPTLFVCGREDAWSPVERHQEMLNLTPNSELAIIDMSGHMSTMEQPEMVSKVINEWLEKHV